MSKLVLIRHGESQWNLENRFTGWVDVPLSPKRHRRGEGGREETGWVYLRSRILLDIGPRQRNHADYP